MLYMYSFPNVIYITCVTNVNDIIFYKYEDKTVVLSHCKATNIYKYYNCDNVV